MPAPENATFEPEGYTKSRLLEALQSAGHPEKKSASKGDLVVAFGELKRGPRSTAVNFLRRQDSVAAEEAAKAKKEAAEVVASAEKKTSGTSSSNGGESSTFHLPTPSGATVWVQLKSRKRGLYGTKAVVRKGVLKFTRENSTVVEVPTSDVAEARGFKIPA